MESKLIEKKRKELEKEELELEERLKKTRFEKRLLNPPAHVPQPNHSNLLQLPSPHSECPIPNLPQSSAPGIQKKTNIQKKLSDFVEK